jgi:hypothetical protein
MATAVDTLNAPPAHPGAPGALSAFITVGAGLESAAFRAREIVRVAQAGHGGQPSVAGWIEATNRASAVRREAHREARAALAPHWLSPRQVQLLALSLAELLQAKADDAASCDAEDHWIAAVAALEEVADAIERAVDAERDAPPASWADVLEAAERVLP